MAPDRRRTGRWSNHITGQPHDVSLVRLKYSKNHANKADLTHSLLEQQDNRCAICGNFLSLNNSKLDHNHITDEIRGVLCHQCNVGLGNFQDDVTILVRAIEYLTGIELEIPEPR